MGINNRVVLVFAKLTVMYLRVGQLISRRNVYRPQPVT